MKVYHGSDLTIKKPDPFHSRRFKMDFGRGFYTTSSVEQARKFTHSVFRKNLEQGIKTVSVYEFDIRAFSELKVKDFQDNLDEWFDYVEQNRRSGQDNYADYDILIGPVADDQIQASFALYEDGIIDKNEALKRLKLEIYKDQIVFKSSRSVDYLTFIRAMVVK